jgi:hypothetical protein
MLYIGSDQEEGNTPAEMGEKESRQASRSLPTMAEASSRTAESRNLPMAPQEPCQMERLPATLAEEKSQTCPGDNAAPLAKNQV